MKKERNSKWTRENIFNAIDTFIDENGRLPLRSEIISDPNLPKHSSVENRFKMSVMDFYETYYKQYIHLCQSRVYHYHTKEYWIDNFKQQYIKLNCPSKYMYDKNRESREFDS